MPPKKKSNPKIEKLVKFILKHRAAYAKGLPLISDAQYDIKYRELKKLDPENPVLDQIVNLDYEGQNLPKAKHNMHLYSQQKAADMDEFAEWFRKLPEARRKGKFWIQHKLDGFTLELQYQGGALFKAVTAGDDTHGFDIYQHAKKMIGVPLEITKPRNFTGSVRGEVVIPVAVFDKKYAHLDKYAAPRNAAVGLARKPGKHLKDLVFIPYDFVTTDVKGKITKTPATFSDVDKFLLAVDNQTPNPYPLFTRHVIGSKLLERVEELYDLRQKERSGGGAVKGGPKIDIDGLVIKSDAIDPDDLERDTPKYQVALKFPPEGAVTKVKDVEWRPNGRTYTPVAVFKMVIIGRCEHRFASCYNPNKLKELDLRVGSEILVTKRGDVIPKVEANLKRGNGAKFKVPEECTHPECGFPLQNDGTSLWCTNEECPNLVEHQVNKYIISLGVKHFGAKMRQAVIANGYTTITQLYQLEADVVAEMETLETGRTFGEKVATKALSNFHKFSKQTTIQKFIAGFDIRTIGARVIDLLVDEGYTTLDKIYGLSEKKLMNIKGIGSKRARYIVNGMKKNYPEMKALIDAGHVKLLKIDGKSAKSKKKAKEATAISVAFTGALSKPRNHFAALAEKANITVKTGVSKGLTYLVTPDPKSGSAKNKAAEKLGIKVIGEAEFLKLLG